MKWKTSLLLLGILVILLAIGRSADSDKIMSKEEALKALFKELQVKEEKKAISNDLKKKLEKALGYKLNKDLDKEKTFFIATKDGNLVNYGCLDTVKDEYGYITYLVKLDLEGKVEQVLVLFHSDEKAAKISFPEFLKQFTKKSAKDPIVVGKDINAATGATVSSRAMADGIRKVILLTQEFYNIKPPQETSETKPKDGK